MRSLSGSMSGSLAIGLFQKLSAEKNLLMAVPVGDAPHRGDAPASWRCAASQGVSSVTAGGTPMPRRGDAPHRGDAPPARFGLFRDGAEHAAVCEGQGRE